MVFRSFSFPLLPPFFPFDGWKGAAIIYIFTFTVQKLPLFVELENANKGAGHPAEYFQDGTHMSSYLYYRDSQLV